MEVNNFDKLVKKITQNIFEKYDSEMSSIMHDKSCLILIPNIGLGFEKYFDYIADNYYDNNLYVGSNEQLSKMHYIENDKKISFIPFDVKNSDFLYLLESVDSIIVLGLKVNQMKALIESDDSEDVNHIILGSLMANKSINIMINTNDFLYHKIANVVTEIRSMGIQVINIQSTNGSSLAQANLITESYVEKLKESGLKVLLLDKKQLITPLAKDKLREFNIKIEYIKEDK